MIQRSLINLVILLSIASINVYAHDIEVLNEDGKIIYYSFVKNKDDEVCVTYSDKYPYYEGDEYIGDIVIPESIIYKDKNYKVTSIGTYAFYGSKNVTSITLPNSIEKIGESFIGCHALTSINIPNSVKEIGEGAFSGCKKITSIVIPEGITTINKHTFYGCASLESIVIPNSVTAIMEEAFYGCTSLESIFIPSSVISITAPCFSYNNLKTIVIDKGNPVYDSRNNCNGIIETKTNTLIQAFATTKIPQSVTTIGKWAFGYSELTTFTIPNWITTIASKAFKYSTIESITIPKSVTQIGGSIFEFCYCLKEIHCESPIPPTTESGIFGGEQLYQVGDEWVRTLWPGILYVPKGSLEAYKNTPWNIVENILEEESETSDDIVVSVNNFNRMYGENNPIFTYVVSGEDLEGLPTITCETTTASPVGTYPIVISKGSIINKHVTFVNGTLTITKAPLKITVGSYTKKQGEENPTFSLTYDGFKNNETAAVFTTQPTITCAATKDSPVGTYNITVSGAVAGNYEISYVAGTLAVEAVTPSQPDTPSTPNTPSMPDTPATPTEPTTPSIPTEPTTPTEPEQPTEEKEFTEQEVSFEKIDSSDGSNTVAIKDDKDASGSVSIPETVTHNGVEYKVTEIGAGAFQNNTSLTEVTIPASIVSIGANAFAGCKNLQSITVNIIVPISLYVASARGFTRAMSGDVFDGVDKETCILYVPEGSVDAYKAAPVWKEFKNILPIKSSTGINGVEAEGEPFDVFTISGQKVKSKVTSLDGLPRGIYIVKGKKVMK